MPSSIASSRSLLKRFPLCRQGGLEGFPVQFAVLHKLAKIGHHGVPNFFVGRCNPHLLALVNRSLDGQHLVDELREVNFHQFGWKFALSILIEKGLGVAYGDLFFPYLEQHWILGRGCGVLIIWD